jgi:ATP-dependent Clp protease ATP-binding subunit ClpC
LKQLKERLQSRKLSLKVSKAVKEYLITQGYQPEFGARPLRRAVERYIEDPLADELLKGTFDDAKGVRVEFDQQKLLFFPA